ncbi:unnamed protein product [Protopolystoma xenopodis]|uniref:Orotidine 5'-phosphate decarboxylase domain-containing protein n=1 Tax=Protopolystoma xenopodis TaxID=117903 RepID=A0A3S5B8Y8_9PLAT|nr:unnamed protein product [Protopolystoma xenopodis]
MSLFRNLFRKLADIGQICLDQLIRGFWRLSEWCDLVTVHCLPGSGPLEAVRKAAEWSLTGSGDSEVAGGLSSHPRGALVEANNGKPKPLKHHLACLVVAEMSSKGSLIDSAYKSKCLEFAKQYPNVVSGFVCQSPFTNLSDAYAPSYWVPGQYIDGLSDLAFSHILTICNQPFYRFPVDFVPHSCNVFRYFGFFRIHVPVESLMFLDS